MVKAPSQAAHTLVALDAAHQDLIQQLQATPDPEQQEALIFAAMANQESQTSAIDYLALIGQSLEAEIQALEAQKRYYVERCKDAITQVERWQGSLERAIIKAHLQHSLPKKMLGHSSFIQIKATPGETEVEVDAKELPPEFQRHKVEPDKAAIKAAWKSGNPVPGTRVESKLKVYYSPAPTSFEGMVRKAKRQAPS